MSAVEAHQSVCGAGVAPPGRGWGAERPQPGCGCRVDAGFHLARAPRFAVPLGLVPCFGAGLCSSWLWPCSCFPHGRLCSRQLSLLPSSPLFVVPQRVVLPAGQVGLPRLWLSCSALTGARRPCVCQGCGAVSLGVEEAVEEIRVLWFPSSFVINYDCSDSAGLMSLCCQDVTFKSMFTVM